MGKLEITASWLEALNDMQALNRKIGLSGPC
jgi:hypothetical protein